MYFDSPKAVSGSVSRRQERPAEKKPVEKMLPADAAWGLVLFAVQSPQDLPDYKPADSELKTAEQRIVELVERPVAQVVGTERPKRPVDGAAPAEEQAVQVEAWQKGFALLELGWEPAYLPQEFHLKRAGNLLPAVRLPRWEARGLPAYNCAVQFQ
jgi:hypothetical protein